MGIFTKLQTYKMKLSDQNIIIMVIYWYVLGFVSLLFCRKKQNNELKLAMKLNKSVLIWYYCYYKIGIRAW